LAPLLERVEREREERERNSLGMEDTDVSDNFEGFYVETNRGSA
jgi:hypothetical protein